MRCYKRFILGAILFTMPVHGMQATRLRAMAPAIIRLSKWLIGGAAGGAAAGAAHSFVESNSLTMPDIMHQLRLKNTAIACNAIMFPIIIIFLLHQNYNNPFSDDTKPGND